MKDSKSSKTEIVFEKLYNNSYRHSFTILTLIVELNFSKIQELYYICHILFLMYDSN